MHPMVSLGRSYGLLIVLFISRSNAQEAKSPWVLMISPSRLDGITEHLPYIVELTLSYNALENETVSIWDDEALYVVKVSSSNKVTLDFRMSDCIIVFTGRDIRNGSNKSLEVIGQVIGYVDLVFHLGQEGQELIPLLLDYRVTVVRTDNTLDIAFTVIMAIMTAISTINMGAGLDLKIVRRNFLRPIGPIVGFFSQFGFMPPFSFLIGLLLIQDKLQGFGLLVLGVCPGGMASNFWTLLLDGDVNLSVTMTFVSSIAAMGMIPLWLWLLSDYFLPQGSAVAVPYVEMTVSLIAFTLPLGVGLLIRRFKPSLARFLSERMMKPFSFLCIFVMLVLGLYSQSHIFMYLDWTLVAAGMSVALSGFIFGGLAAALARLTRGQIVAVSLETAIQNGNIAFVLLKMSLPSPYADMAALPPIAQLLMTSGVLFVLYLSHLAIVYCRSHFKSNSKSNLIVIELTSGSPIKSEAEEAKDLDAILSAS